ncbi:MAG: WecB/TagA/CpsF family glycosyltransferase [Oculatellaceae cyanobacterium Prado106]|jgi:N-acetylglucosaminyldiphosphoundecaprenol N-acetyl-beta-D-mannosaminyltransferase|nr:WecB/TagA/CpsF family glycosyltransferase [Oculatellaceae cyanobacterium Prado106]
MEEDPAIAALTGVVTQNVIGFEIAALSFDAQIELMVRWATRHLSKVVCVANVHMLMEAHTQSEMRSVLDRADLVTPDGMPLVWVMRLLSGVCQDRVAGMDILIALVQKSPDHQIPVFFLGSDGQTLHRIRQRLMQDAPNLQIAGMEPLPFRPLTIAEDEAIAQKIHDSGAGIVLVSLGCPKQELWMTAHKNRINAVMIGLGGAFPVYAGLRRWAPAWVRKAGLEWFYRLIQEPRRLWKRYRKTIPPFLFLAFKQILTTRSERDISASSLGQPERFP